MWIRSAFWIGEPKDEQAFIAAVQDELIPGLKTLPGVKGAQALWPRRLDGDPPAIFCQMLVYFDSLADVDRMLDSPGRAALRGRVREVAASFDGALTHIDYEVA